VVDGATFVALGGGFAGSRRKPTVGLAAGAVALVTAIDLTCAQTLSAGNERNRTRIPDYSNRTCLAEDHGADARCGERLHDSG
jgi:hypothetical protein